MTKCAVFFNLHELAEFNQLLSMADEPVAVANTLASPLGPDRVGQVGENFRASDILLFEVENLRVHFFHI